MQTIPVLKIGPVLLVSIQTELHDSLAVQLQDTILYKIRETQAKAVLIDITAMDIVDSFIARTYRKPHTWQMLWMPKSCWSVCARR